MRQHRLLLVYLLVTKPNAESKINNFDQQLTWTRWRRWDKGAGGWGYKTHMVRVMDSMSRSLCHGVYGLWPLRLVGFPIGGQQPSASVVKK